VSGKKALAIEAFGNALLRLPTIVADNAGLDSSELVTTLRGAISRGEAEAGLDVEGETVGNMRELGITECFKVKYTALNSAFEAAEQILRVDSIIQAAPRQRQ